MFQHLEYRPSLGLGPSTYCTSSQTPAPASRFQQIKAFPPHQRKAERTLAEVMTQ